MRWCLIFQRWSFITSILIQMVEINKGRRLLFIEFAGVCMLMLIGVVLLHARAIGELHQSAIIATHCFWCPIGFAFQNTEMGPNKILRLHGVETKCYGQSGEGWTKWDKNTTNYGSGLGAVSCGQEPYIS